MLLRLPELEWELLKGLGLPEGLEPEMIFMVSYRGANASNEGTQKSCFQGRCSFSISHDYNHSWGAGAASQRFESLLAGLRKELLRCVQEPSERVEWVVLE